MRPLVSKLLINLLMDNVGQLGFHCFKLFWNWYCFEFKVAESVFLETHVTNINLFMFYNGGLNQKEIIFYCSYLLYDLVFALKLYFNAINIFFKISIDIFKDPLILLRDTYIVLFNIVYFFALDVETLIFINGPIDISHSDWCFPAEHTSLCANGEENTKKKYLKYISHGNHYKLIYGFYSYSIQDDLGNDLAHCLKYWKDWFIPNVEFKFYFKFGIYEYCNY